ncbi:PREDICTED: thrombin-like enzyme ancrod [Ceratosolen solmsi marchali]|uniref:Thrombin-like enzyme ancrod n=1 Tax=Ceratosolen solmsi marchali TaxID=326594 RepID=A0AAJ6VNA8_9HYME|nr:PREDICTED: thrombin-like enzyme ancrod [Ceratosolen solmsi marchali]
MYNKTLFLLLQTIILQSISNFPYAGALVGYNIRSVNDNEVPYVVCIAKYSPRNHLTNSIICSGALITPNLILTAEHCFDNLQDLALEVLFRYGQPHNYPIYYPIWWISYDQWTAARNLPITNLNNDIALLKIFGLEHQIIPGVLSDITPINVFYGLNFQLVGCGRTNDDEHPLTVQTANARVLNLNECNHIVSYVARSHLYIPENYICTRNSPYIQTSRGDSGAPVIFSDAIIGINLGVSPPFGNNFHPEKVNIHIYAYLYRDFLNNVIADE